MEKLKLNSQELDDKLGDSIIILSNYNHEALATRLQV
jgi:hypothetical protein